MPEVIFCDVCGCSHKGIKKIMTYPDKILYKCKDSGTYFEKFLPAKTAKNSRLNSMDSIRCGTSSSQVAETSKLAKHEVDRDGVSQGQREYIFQVIKNSKNGLTISQINDLTSLQKSSISPRINELCELKKIYNSGTRIHKNKKGIVWRSN